ncbi:DUF222 domain-containing protein [Agromyces sp. NPDC058484]|uniref:HNH endonuclease signature motif containing protein n=1 Tax=Agromyces sp. NPDC058484 TaxID=3346524 RepID=UPI0036599CF0
MEQFTVTPAGSSAPWSMVPADLDVEEWAPTCEGRLRDCLDLVEVETAALARAEAARFRAIADAFAAAAASPETYVFGPVRSGEDAEFVLRAVAHDIALRVGMSTTAVRTIAAQADVLRLRLPRVWERFVRGEIAAANARVLADVAMGMPHEHDARFEEALLERAGRLVPGRLRTAAQVVRERLERASRQERFDRARSERRISVETVPDGMAWLSLYAPADVVLRARARIDAQARRLAAVDGEARTLEQLRADVAGDILTGAGTPQEVTATVFVTVPLLNLAGVEPARVGLDVVAPGGVAPGGVGPGGVAPDGVATESATLEGYGIIDDATAARLFADAPSFQRIATDPFTGVRLRLDRSRYRPSRAQRDWVRLTHRSCIDPTCAHDARHTDIDHTTDWQHDGLTNDDNLGPLCRAKHRIKHRTRLRVDQIADGIIRFTSPTGAVRDHDPPPF